MSAAPTTIGRYQIIDRLGAGGMGVVYRADDPTLARQVAVKLILAEEHNDQEGRGRLLREAQAMAQLSHPNVVVVHEVGEHDGHMFIAMEYVQGADLRQWLTQPRSVPEILRVLVAAGRGLEAAHKRGIVHRDFKPENVLVDADGRARVCDFGVARAESWHATAQATAAIPIGGLGQALTQTGFAVGTPLYMAAEQFAGKTADARSDQFAFCVSAFEALWGQRPFAADSFQVLIEAVTRGAVIEPPLRPDVPPQLYPLVVRGLAPQPEARHASLSVLLDELERVAQGLLSTSAAAMAVAPTQIPTPGYTPYPAATPAPPPHMAPPPTRESNIGLIIAAGGLVVLLGLGMTAGVAWWLLSPEWSSPDLAGSGRPSRDEPAPAEWKAEEKAEQASPIVDPRRVIVAFEKTSGGGTIAREFRLHQQDAYLQASVRGERTTYRYLSGDVEIWSPPEARKEKKELLFDLSEVNLKVVPKMVRDARKRLKAEVTHAVCTRCRHTICAGEVGRLKLMWRVYQTSGASVIYDDSGRFVKSMEL
jgi:tRNA A-37 threonylcarbamoyl transferase component Bud32